MDWRLEVVTVPVSDMDLAKTFYADRVGFNVDIDQVSGNMRFLQLTPPGSGCSIHLSPGSERLADVKAARQELVDRGVDVGEVMVFDSGEYRPGREGESLDLVGVCFFDDPDGNRWMVQQIPPRG